MIPNPSLKRLIMAVLVLLLAIFSLVFVFSDEEAPLSGQQSDALRNNAEAEADKSTSLLVSPEGLVFEESLSPTLADQINQADFAIAETLRRLGLPESALTVTDEEQRDERGASYRYRSLRVYVGGLSGSLTNTSGLNAPDGESGTSLVNGADKRVPLFVNTLRDCLLAWAAEAQLLREIPLDDPEQTAYLLNIVMEGVVTHSLGIYADGAGPDGSGTTSAPYSKDVPRLVIVMDDLGESPRQAQLLLDLDYPVTFAIWPHSTRAAKVARLAADQGGEVIIHQPMEPIGYPEVNAGAGALLQQMSDQQLLNQLKANLALLPQAIGLNNHMGSRLTQNARIMKLVAEELKKRNLLVLDSFTHSRSQFSRTATRVGLTTYRRDIFLDVQPDKQSVLTQLKKAEQIAILRGQAIAIGHPLPDTLEALQEWQKLRDPKVRLVRLRDLMPLSAK
ncbi:MAG: divergent polysaccharide deacetylase family protein [Deltaproteobacteria bacterium]|jgi:polysaccharide deacetylase 2 family uncharacterized protein YibQ|nr:divergent polysaccharide deacetylase family protein [Deltaproteobacteria bacterium]